MRAGNMKDLSATAEGFLQDLRGCLQAVITCDGASMPVVMCAPVFLKIGRVLRSCPELWCLNLRDLTIGAVVPKGCPTLLCVRRSYGR